MKPLLPRPSIYPLHTLNTHYVRDYIPRFKGIRRVLVDSFPIVSGSLGSWKLSDPAPLVCLFAPEYTNFRRFVCRRGVIIRTLHEPLVVFSGINPYDTIRRHSKRMVLDPGQRAMILEIKCTQGTPCRP